MGRERSGETVLGRARSEGDRAREEWGPFLLFFLREDFEFAERVLWQEVLILVSQVA